jgi:lantibiotic modifying enzyme
MLTSFLIFIIILLLINTLITNIQVRKLIKELNGENPNEFRDNAKKFKKEYKSFIKRWGKF